MSQFVREVLRVVNVALTFIGGGAVLAFIGWLYKRRQENFEDQVLLIFQNSQRQVWHTTAGIHNDYRGLYLRDVPMWVILPVYTNWREGLKWRIRTIPYQARHIWRMKVFMPSLKKVERTMLSLWKRGLLIRNPNDAQHYKLKP